MGEPTAIFEVCPLLIPSLDFKLWCGFIFIESEEVSVSLAIPHYPNLDDLSVKCPITWKRKLQEKLQEFTKSVTSDEDKLLQLLCYLKGKGSHRDSVSQDNDDKTKLVSDSLISKSEYYLYNRVLGELKELGEDKVVWVNGDLSQLTLRVVDNRGVEHRLGLGLASDYPSTRPSIVDIDLPDVAQSQLSQARTITELFETFEQLIESFQDFWTVYEDIKNSTWLIDPENPRLKDTHCRIIIGENVSMLINLNPQDVNTCPDIKFLGPENLVTPFIHSVENKLKTMGWNEDLRLLDNLLNLLGLPEFPQQETDAETEVQQDECSICFTMRLENQTLPIKVCNNVKCDSFFHISCLAQWFQAVPTNEASFNLISGGCPNCGERILCPVNVT